MQLIDVNAKVVGTALKLTSVGIAIEEKIKELYETEGP